MPPWVLAGLVRQESAWNPRAVSSAGAVGLAQLLPSTARELVREAGLPPSWGKNLTDPGANLAIGALLLSRWRQGFGGSWPPTLACYNAGERRVREVWERSGRRAGPEFVESIEIPETHDYVHRVALLAEGYRLLYWPEGKAIPMDVIEVATQRRRQLVDVTSFVQRAVAAAEVAEGMCHVFIPHTTAAVLHQRERRPRRGRRHPAPPSPPCCRGSRGSTPRATPTPT